MDNHHSKTAFPVQGKCEPQWTLKRILGDLDARSFCTSYWATQCLYIERNAPDFYSDLLSLSEIDRSFAMEQMFGRDEVSTPRQGYGRPDPPPGSVMDIYDRFLDGSALRVRNLQKYLDPLAPSMGLIRDMERVIQHPLESLSCYIAPPEAAGLGPHHDETEIFTLQISGEKRWRIYHRVEAGTSGLHRQESLPPASTDIRLRPGDLLYVPSGFVHEVTSDHASFSLTIVFASLRWSDLLGALITHVERLPAFQQAIPPQMLLGSAESTASAEVVETKLRTLIGMLTAMTPEEVLDELAPALLKRMMPMPQMQLENLAESRKLCPKSWVALRSGMDWHLGYGRDRLVLTVRGGASLQMNPAATEALCDVLSRTQPFAIEDIHDCLGPNAKVALARKLIASGILESRAHE